MGESTLRVSHFSPKRWCIMSIIIHNKLKSWWNPLIILNTSKKNLEFAWQHFGTQSSLWVKMNFDPIVRWRVLDQINVLWKYITYNFFTTIGPHVCGSWNITKQKINEKIMECPSINYLHVLYGSGFFFFLKLIIMHLLLQNA